MVGVNFPCRARAGCVKNLRIAAKLLCSSTLKTSGGSFRITERLEILHQQMFKYKSEYNILERG